MEKMWETVHNLTATRSRDTRWCCALEVDDVLDGLDHAEMSIID